MRSAHTEAFWQAFARHDGINHAHYQATFFRARPGVPDRLVAMMEAGVLRTLTSPMHIFGEGRCEPMPFSGNYAVLVDQRQRPRLILRATDVTVGPLAQATDAHVWRSGAGERENWLAHIDANFTHQSRLYGFEMYPEIETVFETVEVVWPLAVARRIRLIAPHLDRGFATLQRLEEQRGVTEGIEAILRRIQTAVLTLDPALRVGYTNPAAEALLRRGDGLRLRNGRLTARSPMDERRLIAAVSAACRRIDGAARSPGGKQPPLGEGAFVSVHRGEGLAPYRISVFPLHRYDRVRRLTLDTGSVIFVDDPNDGVLPAQDDVWSRSFRLTPAEARLAVHLASGATLKDHAEESGVTYNTARAQLRSIFEKTDTHRQVDLVRLLQASRSLRVSLS